MRADARSSFYLLGLSYWFAFPMCAFDTPSAWDDRRLVPREVVGDENIRSHISLASLSDQRTKKFFSLSM